MLASPEVVALPLHERTAAWKAQKEQARVDKVQRERAVAEMRTRSFRTSFRSQELAHSASRDLLRPMRAAAVRPAPLPTQFNTTSL